MRRTIQNLTFFLWGAIAGLLGIIIIDALTSGKILRAALYLVAGAALIWALSDKK